MESKCQRGKGFLAKNEYTLMIYMAEICTSDNDWVSSTRLERETGLSRTTVHVNLSLLEGHSLIESRVGYLNRKQCRIPDTDTREIFQKLGKILNSIPNI